MRRVEYLLGSKGFLGLTAFFLEAAASGTTRDEDGDEDGAAELQKRVLEYWFYIWGKRVHHDNDGDGDGDNDDEGLASFSWTPLLCLVADLPFWRSSCASNSATRLINCALLQEL